MPVVLKLTVVSPDDCDAPGHLSSLTGIGKVRRQNPVFPGGDLGEDTCPIALLQVREEGAGLLVAPEPDPLAVGDPVRDLDERAQQLRVPGSRGRHSLLRRRRHVLPAGRGPSPEDARQLPVVFRVRPGILFRQPALVPLQDAGEPCPQVRGCILYPGPLLRLQPCPALPGGGGPQRRQPGGNPVLPLIAGLGVSLACQLKPLAHVHEHRPRLSGGMHHGPAFGPGT